MTNSEDEPSTGISDEQLPDDLVPSDDNPLAEGLTPDEDPGDLFEDGKRAEEQEDAENEDQDQDQDDGGTSS